MDESVVGQDDERHSLDNELYRDVDQNHHQLAVLVAIHRSKHPYDDNYYDYYDDMMWCDGDDDDEDQDENEDEDDKDDHAWESIR